MSAIHAKERFIGFSCVLVAQMLFGTTFAVNKYVIDQPVNPLVLGFWRILLVTVCIWPFCRPNRGSHNWTAADWRRVVFVGCGAYTMGMVLEYMGTRYTSASNVSLIVSTEAMVAVFLSVLILKERLHYTTFIGGGGAIVGMGMVIYQDMVRVEFHWGPSLAGDGLALMSVLAWGFYTVYSKKIVDRCEPITALFYLSLCATGSFFLINAAGGTLLEFLTIPWQGWVGITYLGIVGSCVGMLLYFQALKRLPASQVALTLTLLPVFGVLFSILLLGETLSRLQLAGAVVIIAGVGYVVYPHAPEHPITEDSLLGP